VIAKLKFINIKGKSNKIYNFQAIKFLGKAEHGYLVVVVKKGCNEF
jgi:hypothetical protein